MREIAIVILNWNGKKDTLECLKSVGQLSIADCHLKIIVVDNGSTDDSFKAIKKKYPKMEVIDTGENLGFSAGNNIGIKKAVENGADFVLTLNNDTIVDKNLITHLIGAADKHKDAGILSPMIYFYPGFEYHKGKYPEREKGRVVWYAGGVIDWDNVLASNYGVDDTDIGQYEKVHEIDFATGACMMIRREAIESVGLFDEKYYLYLEDADLSQRVQRFGRKIIFVPQAKVWHKVSQSSGIGSNLNDYYITRNRLLFGIKYAPVRAKIAIIKESLRLLVQGRPWQRQGVIDFYKGNLGRGSYSK